MNSADRKLDSDDLMRGAYLGDEYFTPSSDHIRAARNVTRWLVGAAMVVFAVIAWWLL